MRTAGTTVSTPTPTQICISRGFGMTADRLYEAHTNPRLLRKWMLGPGGWTMPVCEVDLREGGLFRYEWAHPTLPRMGVSGSYIELIDGKRIVHSERYDEPWYPGECIVTIEFQSHSFGTELTMTLDYEDSVARDIALRTPMADGLEHSFQGLERLDTTATRN